MKKNIGTIDKVIRIATAALIAVLYFTNVISGIPSVVLLVLSGILILTSFVSICPLYLPFGLSTLKKEQQNKMAADPIAVNPGFRDE
jgi:hypothetical protein